MLKSAHVWRLEARCPPAYDPRRPEMIHTRPELSAEGHLGLAITWEVVS